MQKNELALREFTATKKELIAEMNRLAGTIVEAGEEDILQLFFKVKVLHEGCAAFLKSPDLRAAVSQELEQTQRVAKVHAAEISVRNGVDVLDFAKDQTWLQMDQEIKNREAHRKAREVLLKDAVRSDHDTFDADGVLVTRVPLKSSGAEVITVKF